MKGIALGIVLAGSLLVALPAAAADVTVCGTLRSFTAPTETYNVGSATVGDKTYPLSGTPGPNSLDPRATVGSNVCLTGQIAQIETGPENLLIRWTLVSKPAASSAPVVYCGIVAVNTITSGQGSGARTLELQVTSGPGGGGRFHVSDSISFPTVGSYICGQFVQGVPMNDLAALLSPGDTGYVPQAVAATNPPVASAIPIAVTQPQSGPTLGFVELVLIGLAVLVAMGLLAVRSRRSTT